MTKDKTKTKTNYIPSPGGGRLHDVRDIIKRPYRTRPAKNKEHAENISRADELADEFGDRKNNLWSGYQYKQRYGISLPYITIQHKELKVSEERSTPSPEAALKHTSPHKGRKYIR